MIIASMIRIFILLITIASTLYLSSLYQLHHYHQTYLHNKVPDHPYNLYNNLGDVCGGGHRSRLTGHRLRADQRPRVLLPIHPILRLLLVRDRRVLRLDERHVRRQLRVVLRALLLLDQHGRLDERRRLVGVGLGRYHHHLLILLVLLISLQTTSTNKYRFICMQNSANMNLSTSPKVSITFLLGHNSNSVYYSTFTVTIKVYLYTHFFISKRYTGVWEHLWEKVWNNPKCLKRYAFQMSMH